MSRNDRETESSLTRLPSAPASAGPRAMSWRRVRQVSTRDRPKNRTRYRALTRSLTLMSTGSALRMGIIVPPPVGAMTPPATMPTSVGTISTVTKPTAMMHSEGRTGQIRSSAESKYPPSTRDEPAAARGEERDHEGGNTHVTENASFKSKPGVNTTTVSVVDLDRDRDPTSG